MHVRCLKLKKNPYNIYSSFGGNLVLMKTELVAMFMSHKQINNTQ